MAPRSTVPMAFLLLGGNIASRIELGALRVPRLVLRAPDNGLHDEALRVLCLGLAIVSIFGGLRELLPLVRCLQATEFGIILRRRRRREVTSGSGLSGTCALE